jgi:hypothetical protein
MTQSNKSSFIREPYQSSGFANSLTFAQKQNFQKSACGRIGDKLTKEIAMQTQIKPKVGDVRYLAVWIDAATWEKLGRAQGWQPGESLYDYVEADYAEKQKQFPTLEAAKKWAEKNLKLDEWQTPFAETQVYSDDGYGPPYSWEIQTREIFDDGEWADPC